jgi:FkbM family methyltransferase
MRTAIGVGSYVWNHPANKGHRIRQLAKALRFQARGRVLGRPTVVPIGTRSRMLVDLHSFGATKAVYANPPDWPEMLVWRQRLHQGSLFVDVGANVGVYSVWAADLGAEVVAVEPNPAAVNRLKANFDLNGYALVVYQGVLADHAGQLTFDGSTDTTGHISSEGEQVPAFTLDDVLENRVAAGVKIDVEGAERLVLQGAGRALAEHRIKCLQIEWNHQSEIFFGESREPLADLLQKCGYRLLRADQNGHLVIPASADFGTDVFAVVP